MLLGMLDQPVRGAGRLRRPSRRVRDGAAAHPGRACGCSGKKLRAPSRSDGRVAGDRSSAAPRPPHRPRHHGAHGVNVVIILLAGYGSLHAMETPGFCGQVCHTPMHPQFKAWQGGVHAGVACVNCHIGEGARGFVHAKLGGVRQLMHRRDWRCPDAGSAGRRHAPRRAAQLCAGLPQARPHRRRSHPRDSRIRRRRSKLRDDERGADAREPHLIVGTGDSLARRSLNPRSSTWRPTKNRQTIPYVRVTDASGQVKEYVARRRLQKSSTEPGRGWSAWTATTRLAIPSRRRPSRQWIVRSPRGR